jgi:serine/threonine protein phosphatase 1
MLDSIVPGAGDLVIVLGDFVDQGQETRLVIDCLIALQDRCELVCLAGNHEEMLLAARSNEAALRYWEMCGGVQTLNSYRFGGTLDDIPEEHWGFVASCRDWFETANHIFVHANFDPNLPLRDQETHTLRWGLLDPDTVRTHESGKTVVVGHTEQTEGEILDLGFVKCIDTACWRFGWLTALDVASNHVWQASRFGQLREFDEPPVGPSSLTSVLFILSKS